jgi:Chlorophyll A-B binding protein
MTMKFAILASLVAGSLAFVPSSSNSRAKVVTSMAFEDQIGAQPPLGFFDPLGLLSDADEEKFNRLRYTEIKHGRICMLAVLGHIWTTAGSRLPGDIDYSGTAFSDIPAGLAAFDKIPTAGVLQVVAFIGFLELSVMKDVTGGEFVGDFRNGFIDFGWGNFSPEGVFVCSGQCIHVSNPAYLTTSSCMYLASQSKSVSELSSSTTAVPLKWES